VAVLGKKAPDELEACRFQAPDVAVAVAEGGVRDEETTAVRDPLSAPSVRAGRRANPFAILAQGQPDVAFIDHQRLDRCLE
jgi:hypothetical protein